MQTLTFTLWELQELVSVYHETRNARVFATPPVASVIMKNRTNRLFDKLRFAEFEERTHEHIST